MRQKFPLDRVLSVAQILEKRWKIWYKKDKFMVVGSAGRGEPEVADLDILLSPRFPHDIYIAEFRKDLKGMGTWLRGGDRQMKTEVPGGLKLDIFLQHPPAQWGVLVAVRLNPAPFVIWAKQNIDAMGLKREGGTIYDANGYEIPIPTEQDYFNLLGLDWVEPDKRVELCEKLGISLS